MKCKRCGYRAEEKQFQENSRDFVPEIDNEDTPRLYFKPSHVCSKCGFAWGD